MGRGLLRLLVMIWLAFAVTAIGVVVVALVVHLLV